MRSGADGEDDVIVLVDGAEDEVDLLVLDDDLLGLAEVGEVQRRLDVVQDDAVVGAEHEHVLLDAWAEAVDSLAVPVGENGADGPGDFVDHPAQDPRECGDHGSPTSEFTCTASSAASFLTILWPARSFSTKRSKARLRAGSNQCSRMSASASGHGVCFSGRISTRKRTSNPHGVRTGALISPGFLSAIAARAKSSCAGPWIDVENGFPSVLSASSGWSFTIARKSSFVDGLAAPRIA